MSLHPGTGSYNPAGNSDFTRKAEAMALGIAKSLPNHWPTPAAQNWKGSSEASITRSDGKSRMDLLHYRAEQGFTRPAPATSPDGRRSSPHAPISRPRLSFDDCLAWARRLAADPEGPVAEAAEPALRRMADGLAHRARASRACSATEFTLWQQHMRGALSQLPMASGPWIWRPTDAAQRLAQMDFLEGLLP